MYVWKETKRENSYKEDERVRETETEGGSDPI